MSFFETVCTLNGLQKDMRDLPCLLQIIDWLHMLNYILFLSKQAWKQEYKNKQLAQFSALKKLRNERPHNSEECLLNNDINKTDRGRYAALWSNSFSWLVLISPIQNLHWRPHSQSRQWFN